MMGVVLLLCLVVWLCHCSGLSTIPTTATTPSTSHHHLLRRADLRGDRSITKGEEYRDYCTGCSRPPTQCLCEHLPSKKIELETEVLVLQHPVEFRRKTISTVLLKLVLEQCRVLVGRSFDSKLESIINEACAEGRIPLLLFPGPNATVLKDCDKIDHYNQMLLHF